MKEKPRKAPSGREAKVAFVRTYGSLTDHDLCAALLVSGLYSPTTTRAAILSALPGLRRDAQKLSRLKYKGAMFLYCYPTEGGMDHDQYTKLALLELVTTLLATSPAKLARFDDWLKTAKPGDMYSGGFG